MGTLKINTRNANVNTKIIVYSNKDLHCQSVVDLTTGITYKYNKNTQIYFAHGKHYLYAETLNEQIVVTVENTIKFGGPKLNLNANFISSETPWNFVTKKDRLYIMIYYFKFCTYAS